MITFNLAKDGAYYSNLSSWTWLCLLTKRMFAIKLNCYLIIATTEMTVSSEQILLAASTIRSPSQGGIISPQERAQSSFLPERKKLCGDGSKNRRSSFEGQLHATPSLVAEATELYWLPGNQTTCKSFTWGRLLLTVCMCVSSVARRQKSSRHYCV